MQASEIHVHVYEFVYASGQSACHNTRTVVILTLNVHVYKCIYMYMMIKCEREGIEMHMCTMVLGKQVLVILVISWD